MAVNDRWVPSNSALSPLDAPAAGRGNTGQPWPSEQEHRRTTCNVSALVEEPAAVAFLLTHELGIAHVTWKHSMYPAGRTIYTLRLV